MLLKSLTLIAIGSCLTPALAHAWGSYGHEQVNAAALDLIDQKAALGQCLAVNNRNLMIRYAITPDADWKMLPYESRALSLYRLFQNPNDPRSQATLAKELEREEKSKTKHFRTGLLDALRANPKDVTLLSQMKEDLKDSLTSLSPESLELKRSADQVEHSLHFWEADAFSSELTSASIENIASSNRLSSRQYDGAQLERFKVLVAQNFKRISEMDPEKAKEVNSASVSSRNVIQHGTAPWRVQQLFTNGVKSLKNAQLRNDPEQLKLALLYLGSMGHYVGDMSQPFHATLNFDGQAAKPNPQNGIHHNYEEQILEDEALASGKPLQDKASGLWTDLGATHAKVVELANRYVSVSPTAAASQVGIVSQVMSLVASGYELIPQLLQRQEAAQKLFPDTSAAVKKLNEPGSQPNAEQVNHDAETAPAKINPKAVQAFRGLEVNFEKRDVTVLESAEMRMARSSALLAKLWTMALQSSQVSDDQLQKLCGKIDFDRAYTIKNYPKPNYHLPMTDFYKIEPKAAVVGADSNQSPNQSAP